MATLNDMFPGQTAVILALDGPPALVQRLYELGLCEGELIEFLTTAPLGDPIEIRTGNTRLSLRKSEAAGVHIQPPA
jgi:ferrous iron transport protein A